MVYSPKKYRETEGIKVRRLGFDLSQAKLEAIALSKGITKSYREMDQAQKSQLRYYAILTQVTTAQGDMARTLEAPANQIRILKAQIVQAARALGNIFIPVLNKVLPYIIAFAKAIRIVANEIAKLFHFELPEVDYSGIQGVSSGAEDAEEKLNGATGAAGKFKKMLLGIDELNVLPDKNAGGGAGGLGGDDGWKDFKLPEYNFIGDAINNKTNEILNSFKPLGDWVKENLNVFETFGEIDFSILSDSLKGLGESLKPLTRSVFDGIAWAYENIFEPIAHWTAEDFLPSFIDALSSTIDLLNETIEIFKPLGEWFWEKWLKPLGEWTGGAIVDTLDFLSDALDGITSWAEDNEDWLEPIVTSIGKLMVSLFMISSPLTSTIVLMRNLAKAFKWIENAALTAWQHIKEFFSPAVEWFSKLFGKIKDTVSSTFEVIGGLASGAWEVIKTAWSKASGWFNENFIEPISDAFFGLWGKIKQGASDAWEGIKEFFEPAKEWFKEKFGSIWEDIIAPFKEDGNIFVNIRDGVANLFKKIVNGLITGINNVISKPFNVINNILTGIRDTEIFGFRPFKNLGTINVPSIPYLAKGGMVNEGQMFVAREAGPEMVGTIGGRTAVANNDQIVSAVSAGVYSAVRDAMRESSGGEQHTTVNVDGDALFDFVVSKNRSQSVQYGYSPLLG